MRAVIDTNVLLSGLLWHGQPHPMLKHVRAGTLAMVSSPASAQVDLIVSGDDDLLVLQAFERIPIVTPAQALQPIGSSGAILKT